MRSKIYVVGLALTVLLLALGFRILPAPWQGGTVGWFSALWYLSTLAAGLGYWYKFDLAKGQEERRRQLAQARRARAAQENHAESKRQRAH
jgi:hypothetical protein